MRSSLLPLLLLLALTTPARSATFSALAADDGHVEGPSGGAYSILDTGLFVALVLEGNLTFRREALFEYDIRSIPAGAQVVSAIWRIQTSSESGTFQVHGYVADGVLELADASVPDNPLGAFDGGIFGTRDVTLELAGVQALIDGGSGFLGLSCRGVPGAGSSLQISTKEISSAEARAARLILEYTEATDAPAAGRFALRSAVPNPFNPATELAFELDHAGPVHLRIYDVRGRSVRTLLQGERPAGLQRVRWNGTDDRGQALPSGVYLAEMREIEGSRRAVLKLTLVR